jgi:hypothetical protein
MRHPDVAVVKHEIAAFQLNRGLRFYDRFAIERSLVPSADATGDLSGAWHTTVEAEFNIR